jgi:hypothetical protein
MIDDFSLARGEDISKTQGIWMPVRDRWPSIALVHDVEKLIVSLQWRVNRKLGSYSEG